MAELDLAGIITRVCTDLMTKLRTRFSKVFVTNMLNRGTWIASINIDGTYHKLYAPTPPSGSTTLPLMDGVASVGNIDTYALANHVHPTDTSRQATLVSGTNIKTINGNSILGSGNLTIGGGEGSSQWTELAFEDVFPRSEVTGINGTFLTNGQLVYVTCEDVGYNDVPFEDSIYTPSTTAFGSGYSYDDGMPIIVGVFNGISSPDFYLPDGNTTYPKIVSFTIIYPIA